MHESKTYRSSMHEFEMRKGHLWQSFHKAEIYHLQYHFKAITFFKINLTGITPHTGGQVRKNLMIKVAHTKLGHDKENPKDPKDLSFS